MEAIADAFEKQRAAASKLGIHVKVRLDPTLLYMWDLKAPRSILFWWAVMPLAISYIAVFSSTRYFLMYTCADLLAMRMSRSSLTKPR